MNINKIVKVLLDKYTRTQIADMLNVSPAMVSTWLNPTNDYTPRFKVAARLYKVFGYVVWPYDEKALAEEAGVEYDSEKTSD